MSFVNWKHILLTKPVLFFLFDNIYICLCVCVCFVIDLQNVDITLRILYRPVADTLPDIFTNLGIDYAERVLPSIVNEVLKAVVVSTIC